MRARTAQAVFAAVILLSARAAAGEDEIKIGQTMPYSGPVSAASTFGFAERG